MRRLVQGFGINDVDHATEKCVFYGAWIHMIRRSYDAKFQGRNLTYIGCSVCEEWRYFSKFKEWMKSQDWQGKQLDKDILIEGNKLYSPDTCAFISAATNTLLNDCGARKGKYPTGVSFHKENNRFQARCWDGNGTQTHLGYFETPGKARQEYLKFKANVIRGVALLQDDLRVREALIRRADYMF